MRRRRGRRAGVLGTVLTQQFHLTRAALPPIIGSSFIGMFFGAMLLGRYADRAGRRTAFLLSLGIYSGFTLGRCRTDRRRSRCPQ